MNKITPKISKDEYIKILLDKDVTRADDLLMFQTLYSFVNHKASATDIALKLEWNGRGAVVMKF